MLTPQHKKIDSDKDKPSPYPKDFTRWYALDYFKRPGLFRSKRGWVTLGVTGVAIAHCAWTMADPRLHRTHQTGPVSTAHAMFNQNCANCHKQTFAPLERLVGCPDAVSISDQTCNQCHHGSPHNQKTSSDPACVTCHVEHRGNEVLAKHVASRHCNECHGNLANHLKSGATTEFVPTVTSFTGDHPDFRRSKKGEKDKSKIKFNHKAHLDLSLQDLASLPRKQGENAAKLDCIQCHQLDAERRYFLPISYEQHCATCHQLNVALAGDFAKDLKAAAAEFSNIPLPHKEPTVVRAVLRDRLVAFAQKNAVVSAKAEPNVTPRPLPWKPADVSDAQWSWTIKQATQAESLLFMNKQWQKSASLTWCSHCHIEKTPNERIDGLPAYETTNIPSRWHEHSMFSHGAHRMMSCVECHDRNAESIKVANSQTAEDVLLPTIKSCQECHRPASNAGAARDACVTCHRYHDRKLERNPGGSLSIEALLGKTR